MHLICTFFLIQRLCGSLCDLCVTKDKNLHGDTQRSTEVHGGAQRKGINYLC
jgi:hypothetical protein